VPWIATCAGGRPGYQAGNTRWLLYVFLRGCRAPRAAMWLSRSRNAGLKRLSGPGSQQLDTLAARGGSHDQLSHSPAPSPQSRPGLGPLADPWRALPGSTGVQPIRFAELISPTAPWNGKLKLSLQGPPPEGGWTAAAWPQGHSGRPGAI